MLSTLLSTQRLVIIFAVLTLGTPAALAQRPIQITTKLETRPDVLIGEEYLFLVAEEKANLNLAKEPGYQSAHPRYAKVSLGNAPEKSSVAVVVDEAEGKSPRVYIDANNNRDLTDDVSPDWIRDGYDVLRKDLPIEVSFVIDGKPRAVELPYRCVYFSREEREHVRVALQPRFDRSGVLPLNGKEHRMVMHTTNRRGLYSDPKEVILGIDRNLDGRVDGSRLSGELFKGSESFNIGGESYRLTRLSELGEDVSVAVSPDKVPQKEHVAAGERAPDFEFQTLDGRKLKLSDFRGRVVLLDFMATWCSPCIAALPGNRRLREQFGRSKFEIISVSLDGGETSKVTRRDLEQFAKEHRINWPVFYDGAGWKNAAAQKYNVDRLPVHLVVDQAGMIRLIGRSGGEEETKRTRAAVTQLIGE